MEFPKMPDDEVRNMLIEPYGHSMINRLVTHDEYSQLCTEYQISGTTKLSHDDLINAVNIAVGCYSPITGFMTRQEYESVIELEALPSGLSWTIPILLHVSDECAKSARLGSVLRLKNDNGDELGLIKIDSIFDVDQNIYCLSVFGTGNQDHPGVRNMKKKSIRCVGGTIFLIKSAVSSLRHFRTPEVSRNILSRTGKNKLIAFTTRNICHLGHEHLHTLSLKIMDILGILVITGADIPGNFLPDVVFDTYKHLMSEYYPDNRVILGNLRLPPLFAGPKEAYFQAIILQNYGYSHFIVGRDHAGVGAHYEKYASQKIFERLTGLDIEILGVTEQRYCKVCEKITTARSCRHGGRDINNYNGRDVRRLLAEKEYAELSRFLRPDLVGIIEEILQSNVNLPSEINSANIDRQIFYT